MTARRLPYLTAAAAAALYLAVPAARYNFDGVACAIAVDLGDLKHLVHGNHLGYGIAGYGWFSLWRLFGYSGPALYSLQAFSSLLGAAAVGALTRLLLRLGARPGVAAAAALGCAVSEVYWTWSLEAQVYPLGALFLVLAAGEALREKPRPVVLGLLQAGAVLGHVGHMMFTPAALYALRFRPRDVARYAGAAAAALFLAYGAAALFCVKPHSFEDVRVWLLGSAALTLDKRFFWHGGWSWPNVAGWLSLSTRLWGGGACSAAAGCGLAAYGFRASTGARRRAATMAALWLAGHALLFISWEPRTPVYRMSDLPALWLLIALGVEALPGRAALKTAALACAVAGLGAWNLARVALPGGDPKSNEALQRVLRLAPSWPENAWVVAGDQYQVYVPYFAHRRPIDPRYYRGDPRVLDARLKALAAAGEPVFVLPGAVTPEWRAWFQARPHDAPDAEMWRLR